MEVILAATSGGLLVGAVGLIALGLLVKRAHRAEQHLAILGRTLDEERATRSEEQEEVAFLTEALGKVHEKAKQLDEEVTVARRTARQSIDATEDLEDQLSSLTQRLAVRRNELNTERQGRRRAERLLSAVGLHPLDARKPLEPAHRPHTLAVLRELVASTDLEGAAISDREGLLHLAVGDPRDTRSLAASITAASGFVAAASAVLCAPIDQASIWLPTRALHFLRMDERFWLGVLNNAAAPSFALQSARLRMLGEAPVPPTIPEVPDTLPDIESGEDARLAGMLASWGRRWGAEAALLGPDGHALAATDEGLAGPLLHLRREARPLMRRVIRDRFPLSSVVWAAGGAGAWLSVAALEDDLETPLLCAVSASALPVEALDELAATLRWQLHTTERVAS